jgi:hypothetical protein
VRRREWHIYISRNATPSPGTFHSPQPHTSRLHATQHDTWQFHARAHSNHRERVIRVRRNGFVVIVIAPPSYTRYTAHHTVKHSAMRSHAYTLHGDMLHVDARTHAVELRHSVIFPCAPSPHHAHNTANARNDARITVRVTTQHVVQHRPWASACTRRLHAFPSRPL